MNKRRLTWVLRLTGGATGAGMRLMENQARYNGVWLTKQQRLYSLRHMKKNCERALFHIDKLLREEKEA